MIKLDTRCKQYSIVIDAPKNNPTILTYYQSQFDLLNGLGVQFISIIHNHDIDKDGVLKTPHIHLIYSCETRPRAKKVLTDLSDILNCNVEQIQIQTCLDLSASVQYLTHKNHKSKYQYDYNSIYTNISESKLKEYYDKDINCLDLTFDDLLNIYYSTKGDKLEIMKIIGLGRYTTYRSTINDLIQLMQSRQHQSSCDKHDIEQSYKDFDDFN